MADRDVAEHESDATVRGFFVLRDEHVVWFPDLKRNEAPEQQFRLGAAPYSDIRIGSNPEVADTHCLLVWSLERLEVRDRAPGKITLFNGLAVDGFAHMCAGDVLTIGSEEQLRDEPEKLTHIMAFRHSPNESPKIPVRNFPEYVVKTREYLGDNRAKAARTIQLSESTYSRRLKEFAVLSVVICAVAAGGFWFSSSLRSERVIDKRDATTGSEAALLAPAAASEPVQKVVLEEPAISATEKEPIKDKQPVIEERKPKRSKRKRQKKAGSADTTVQHRLPRARGASDHFPVGARGVTASDRRLR